MSSFCGDDVDWRLLFLFVKPKCRLVWCKRRWNWPRAWPVSPLINNRMSLSLSSSLTIHRLWLFDYLTIGLFDYLTIWLFDHPLWNGRQREETRANHKAHLPKEKARQLVQSGSITHSLWPFFFVLFGSLRRLSSIWWLCLTVLNCGCATSARRRIIITRSLSSLSFASHHIQYPIGSWLWPCCVIIGHVSAPNADISFFSPLIGRGWAGDFLFLSRVLASVVTA